MLYDLSLSDFIAKTASSDPVPGGGSVSAMCGSLSAALAKMVAGLTVGKKNYLAVSDQMQKVVDEMPAYIESLKEAIQEDSNSFDGVMAAFKLPKETEEDKAKRRKAIDDATVIAAKVPLKTAETVAQLFPTLEFVAANGNKNAMSDIAVATMLARTAVFGALYNVRINLAGLPDSDFKTETYQKVTALHETAEIAETKILKSIIL